MKSTSIKVTALCILLLGTTPSFAGDGWKKFWNGAKKVGGQLLKGAATGLINTYLPEYSEGWNKIIEEYDDNNSYGSTAGMAFAKGNWADGIKYAAAAAAEEAGVNTAVVDAGVSAVDNISNGDYGGATLDITQICLANRDDHNGETGYAVVQYIRDVWAINKEYQTNVANGMDIETAQRIRDEKIEESGNRFGDKYVEIEESFADKKIEIRQAIRDRGYSESEVNYYYSVIKMSHGIHRNVSTDSLLNIMHIYDKSGDIDYQTSYPGSSAVQNNGFFEDFVIPTIVTSDSVLIVNDTVISEAEPPAVESTISERDIAVETINKTIVGKFICDGVALSEEQKTQLDEIANKMMQYSDMNLTIVGHTCNIGTDVANEHVGTRRAQNAKNYLIEKGIAEERIAIDNKSNTEPVVENNSEENRKQNRRITFFVR